MLDNYIKLITAYIKEIYEYFLNLNWDRIVKRQWVDDPQKNKSVNRRLVSIVSSVIILSIFWETFTGLMRSGCARLLDQNDMLNQVEKKVMVEASPLTLGTMTKRITAVGRTKASESVIIKAELHARIKSILFTEGGSVEKDQIIIEFENDDLKAKLKMAEVRLKAAKSQFERTEKLHQQKLGSSKEYDKDKSDLDQADAQVAQYKAELDKTIIKAPFSGKIGLIDFNVGAYVSANTDLVTLVQSNPMRIDFKIPEKFAKDVGAGQVTEVRVDTFKDRVFTGYVEAVDSKVDPDSNSLSVKATINNDAEELIPGLFTNVSLIIGERHNTPMVDEAAILREGTLEYVWVVEKGKAHRKQVRTGVREKGMVEITAGLVNNEVIITSGQVRLQSDGTKVKVINDPEIIKKETEEKAKQAEVTEKAKPLTEKLSTSSSEQDKPKATK